MICLLHVFNVNIPGLDPHADTPGNLAHNAPQLH